MTDRELVDRHARIFGYPPNLNSINYISGRIKKLSELIKGDSLKSNNYIGEMKELMLKINDNSKELDFGTLTTAKRSIELRKRKSVHINKTIGKAENPRDHFYGGIEKIKYHQHYDGLYH